MRKVNFLIIAVLALTLIGAMVGCGEATPTPTATPTATPVEPVKIGLLEDLSGPAGPYGIARFEGAKVAVQMVNDAGGIKSLGGAKVILSEGAGDTTPATSVSEMERLISSEKVVGIVGPTTSSETMACIPLLERYKVPAVTTLSDEEQFKKGYRYIFSMDPYARWEGERQAEFIDWLAKNHGAPTDSIAICAVSPAFTIKSQGVADRLIELGYTNIVLTESFPLNVTDHTPLVMKLKAANPSLVYYCGAGSDGIVFQKACYTYDYYPWLVCDDVGYGTTIVLDGLDTTIAKKTLARPNIFGVGRGIADEALKDVDSLKNFKELHKKAYPNSTASYPSVACGGFKTLLLIRAIENAASRNPEDIAEALRKTDIQAPDPYLIYGDAYPRFTLTESGGGATSTIMAEQWTDDLKGKLYIWPEDLATADPKIQK